MGAAASSLERMGSILPTPKEVCRTRTERYSNKEIHLMETLLPSFVYRGKSTEIHRHLAAVHWDTALKDPPVVKSELSARVSHREGRSTQVKESKIMQLYDVFFAYLEEHSPELKPVFRSSLHVRGRVLVHISVGMRSLIVSENLMDKILSLTKTHRRFGVKIEHYEPLGRALFHAMQVVSGHHWTPEVDDAWRRLFSHTSVLLITAQQKIDPSATSDAAKPTKKTAVAPSAADVPSRFLLNRKSSARDSAATGATTITSSPRDTERITEQHI